MKVKVVLFLLFITFFTFSTGITYLYFHSTAEVILDQKLAAFVFNVEKQEKLEIPLEDLNPGDSSEYTFSVSNSDKLKTSNVTIEYQIALKTYHLVPLDIELYKVTEEKEELVLTCNEDKYSRNEKNELVCNTEKIKLDFRNVSKDDYKLKLVFPSQYNDISYSNLIDFIDVEITSNQVV